MRRALSGMLAGALMLCSSAALGQEMAVGHEAPPTGRWTNFFHGYAFLVSNRQGGPSGVANSLREDSSIVWKLNPDKTLEPIQVGLGVTDFTFTAMTNGKLNPGDDLVIGQSTTKNAAAQTPARSPVGGAGGPGGPGGAGAPRRF